MTDNSRKRKPLDMTRIVKDPEFFFNAGMRKVERGRFAESVKYLTKASVMDPFNADYKFNLACILAELKRTSQSNDLLLDILVNIDPTIRECYFGIGCNFFDMGDLKKAGEYFEKYAEFDPHGQFNEEAGDILYYLQVYNGIVPGRKTGRLANRYAAEGRRHLNAGNLEKAKEALLKAVEINPELIPPRNDLSLVYLLDGSIENAISMAKSVLRLEPFNVPAHCNLVIFFNAAGKPELSDAQLCILLRQEIRDRDELYRVLNTCIKLKKHDSIAKLLKKHIKNFKEPVLCQILASSLYNLHKAGEAITVWRNMVRAYPQYKVVTDRCIRTASGVEADIRKFSAIEYPENLSGWIDRRDKSKLNDFLQSESCEHLRLWENDPDLRDIVIYSLYEGDHEAKARIVAVLAQINDSSVRELLKAVLVDKNTGKETKALISSYIKLKKAGPAASEPAGKPAWMKRKKQGQI